MHLADLVKIWLQEHPDRNHHFGIRGPEDQHRYKTSDWHKYLITCRCEPDCGAIGYIKTDIVMVCGTKWEPLDGKGSTSEIIDDFTLSAADPEFFRKLDAYLIRVHRGYLPRGYPEKLGAPGV